MTLFGLTKLSLALSSAYESLHALVRFQDRVSQFKAAQSRAKELNRKLVVIGDPDAGLHTRIVRAYDCGDICIDLTGCPACPTAMKLDITKDELPFAANSVVIYEACVLEYVDDLGAAWNNLMRVAGGRDNYFGVRVSPASLTSRFFGGAKWIFYDTAEPYLYRAVRISNSTKTGSSLYGVKQLR